MTDEQKVKRMLEIRIQERPDLKNRMNDRVREMFKSGTEGFSILLKMYNDRFPEKTLDNFQL